MDVGTRQLRGHWNLYYAMLYEGFLGGSESKESACNAGDPGLIPGLGRSPGEGNGLFLPGEFYGQRSLVVTKSWTRLNDFQLFFSQDANDYFSSISSLKKSLLI